MRKSFLLKGFTLVELMIALAVLVIIVSIAYPSYQQQLRQSRRADGQAKLMEIMQAQQKFFSDNNVYTTDLVNDLNFPNAGGGNVASDNNFYRIGAAACTGFTIATCVNLTATALAGQAVDGNMTFNSRNQKTPVALWD